MMTTTTIKEFQSVRLGTPPKAWAVALRLWFRSGAETHTERKNQLEEQDPERQEENKVCRTMSQ